MKKDLYYGLMMGCLLGISPLTAMAQTEQELERGDSLVLNGPDGYPSYQWQVSTDLKNFVNIPDATQQKLGLKVYGPGYYRVKAMSADYHNVYPDTVQVSMKKKRYYSTSVTGGAHGFVETVDGQPGAKGINIPEDREGALAGSSLSLTNWTNGNSMAVYYLHHPSSIIDTDMTLKVKNGQRVSFRVKIYDPSNMDECLAENIVAFKGTGKDQTVRLIGTRFKTGSNTGKYYRYQLECLNGWNNIIEISKFACNATSKTKSYKSGYLSSPSVHLNSWRSTEPGAPSGKAYDWCYMEVMMPDEADIPGTYIMSLGVLHGYMGIQMNGYENGKQLHDVIFSMWDDGDTDKNPDLPENLRSKEVDLGPGVIANRFGNEGTGIKSFKKGYNWDCGKFVQFITNSRPEEATYTIIENGQEKVIKQKNTLCSTWYNAQDGKGWQYMATLRLANQERYFDSWYSFLENYNYPTGQALRRGYYRNGYARSKDQKKWYHFNQVNFGHTDGGDKEGARNDFGQGVCDEFEQTFFMTTGGFIPSKVTSSVVPLNKTNTPVDTINLDKLLLRVDQAIAKEKAMIDAQESFKNDKLNKDGWKVIKFSSEEAKGEGSNGHASQIIDGDNQTYWHSQWQGNKASYPHEFVIDMIDEHPVAGVQLTTSSGGGNRHIKACNLYLSLDNSTWEKVYSGEDMPDQDVHQIVLTQPVDARYIKLEITNGYASEGPFVRVNEIDVIEGKQTGIGSVNGNGQLEVACGQHDLLVKAPAALDNAEISVFRTDGACIYSNTYSNIAEGEVVRVPMTSSPKGVYVVSCKAGNLNISKQVMWNK